MDAMRRAGELESVNSRDFIIVADGGESLF